MKQFRALVFLAAAIAFSTANCQALLKSDKKADIQIEPISRLKPSGYIRLAGKSGFSIEVPNDWRLLSTKELTDSAKLRSADDQNRDLELFALAQSRTTGALISVDVRRPSRYTQRELNTVSESTLRTASEQNQREFKGKKSQSGIGTLVSGPTYSVRELRDSADRALMLSYRELEVTPKGRSIYWKTTQLHVPRSKDELEVTLSYHEDEEVFWRPVMEYAIQSLRH